MNKNKSNQIVVIFFISLCLFLVSLSLLSCTLLDQATEPLNRDTHQTQIDLEDTWIIGGDAALYKSVNDPDYEEYLEPGTPVIKTGRCRKGKVEEGSILCPVKILSSDKRGWVMETALIEFEDYLP